MSNEIAEKPSNQLVTKLLQLLKALADSRTPMKLQDIVAATGIPQATCLRYLNALLLEGYAFQYLDSGRYSLTWGMCNLGDKVRSHQSIRTMSGDIVNELSLSLEIGICLVIEHDMECMYLDCLYEPEAMGASLMRIGKQTPMHAASSGKILLTEYSDDGLDKLIGEKGLPSLTPRTITTKQGLREEINRVRQQGYAIDDEECEDGIRCVAVPIYDFSGKVSAAVSAFGSVEKVTDEAIQERILPALQRAAKEISFRMGSAFAPLETADTEYCGAKAK